MLGTFDALTSASLAQNAALPSRPPGGTGGWAWEGFRKRNTALDSFFYDVKTLSPEEAQALGRLGVLEGSLVLVPPSGMGEVSLWPTLDALAAAGGTTATSLCIAGVGSSALGSAAFARNVADATGKPALAVVSGYGMSDLITEALGGWFWFGGVNQARHAFEALEAHRLPAPVAQTGAASAETSAASLDKVTRNPAISRDTQVAFALLCDQRFDFQVLTGHSKGNLVMSEALYAFVRWSEAEQRPIRSDRLIVTFSATIAVPPAFTNVIDVIGGADPLGRLNSRWDIPVDKRAGWSGHHTNTEILGHLPVTALLREILAEQGR
ncbi:hypothetical protein J2X65_000835 [Ancylobacter sp. 3268]|uniref:hypothetical protein n=1 Tax=Ancylobacter sp. 3268 TaxID=2817752 RepID=UPI002862316D|nr:hypothetical protein [Ancylobacter sp. 3268]MDR6951487.1 hypothetical protein [Ancylobacter sp. 3268]